MDNTVSAFNKVPPKLYLDTLGRGHFPPVSRGGLKRSRRQGRITTPRPTPQLLQSKAPSKLVPDLGHTGIKSSLEPPELQPILPNSRLNPNFVKLANRRAHEVMFDRVRVERKKDIAPLQNFTHENHYDFTNKIMIDILEERAQNAERARRFWDKQKAAAGFADHFDSFSKAPEVTHKPKPAEQLATTTGSEGGGVTAVRPKKYFNTLSLFECLWDSTEPKKTKVAKYGAALAKKRPGPGDVFVKKNGEEVVLPQNWDPEAVFDAHFGRYIPPDDIFAEPGPSTIEGMNQTISRDEIKTMSNVRRGFASPLKGAARAALALNATI